MTVAVTPMGGIVEGPQEGLERNHESTDGTIPKSRRAAALRRTGGNNGRDTPVVVGRKRAPAHHGHIRPTLTPNVSTALALGSQLA